MPPCDHVTADSADGGDGGQGLVAGNASVTVTSF